MNYKRLIVSLALPQLAGVIGSVFTTSAISTWYAALERPSFSPPNWLFGPAWITLYVLMGISIYLVWQKLGKNKQARQSFWLFWIHLIFNATWSIAFFGLQNPGLALINIIIILAFIIVLMTRFWRIDHLAAYLLIPYFLWVSFAALLNYSFWILN